MMYGTPDGLSKDRVVAIAPTLPAARYQLAVAEMDDGQSTIAVREIRRVRQLAQIRTDLPWADRRFWIVMADQDLAITGMD